MKILYFSTVNWNWIKQRPHFLCEYLSKKDMEVTYFSMTPFLKQRIFNKRLNTYLDINDKFVLPYASKINIIKTINSIYVKQLLNKKYDIVILTHPEQYYYLPKDLRYRAKIIYDCLDNSPYFYEGNKRCEVQRQEKEVCKKAHQIITSSRYLKNKIMKEYMVPDKNIEIVKNALDKSLENECKLLIKLKSPNLVYIGTIGEWLDINILIKYAHNNPNCTIYLIGPVDSSIRKKIHKKNQNIIFLGAIKHEEIKKYIIAGEIMLIPFKVNELIEGVDPVKLYEYLALNKPVITSYWDELEEYKSNNLVHFYDTYEQFVLGVEKIKNEVNTFSEINTDFIEKNNWEKRVESYVEIINKIM